MTIDHVVMIIIGVLGVALGLYTLAAAKTYRSHQHENQNGQKHV